MTISALQSKLNSALVTNAAGDYALRTMIDGPQNLGGNYLLNEQTTTNMMSKGTVYRFDGVDDKIIVPHVASLAITGDLFVMVKFKTGPTFGTMGVFTKGGQVNTDREWGVFLAATEISFGTTKVEGGYFNAISDSAPVTDTEYTVVGVISGTTGTLYVNGIAQSTTFTFDGTRVTPSKDIAFGAYNEGGTGFFNGTISEAMLGNFAPTAAEVKDLISGNIPFKWVGGSQTELVTNGAFAADTDWSKTGSVTIAGTCTFNSGSNSSIYQTIASPPLGQMILVQFDIVSNAGTSTVFPVTQGARSGSIFSTATAQSAVGTVAGTYTYRIPADATAARNIIGLQTNNTIDGDIVVDNFSATLVGAVALYDQTSISETYWYDKANGNDGAVTGASVLNPPSVTPLACLRSARIKIEPGATPGTNIKLTDVSTVNNSFNSPALIDAAAIVKGDTPASTSTSFGLSAGGTGIKIDLGYTPAGVLPHAIIIHDMNSSTATEIYFVDVAISSGLLELTPRISGSVTAIDWTTIMDLGDRMDILLSFITATG